MTFEAGFNHAAHTVIAILLLTILITQVHIDRRDAIADSAQSILDDAIDLISQCLVTFNVVISSDLNLHGVLLGLLLVAIDLTTAAPP